MTADEKAIEEAEREGFDLGLMCAILELSPEERLLRHDTVLEKVLALGKPDGALYAQTASLIPRFVGMFEPDQYGEGWDDRPGGQVS